MIKLNFFFIILNIILINYSNCIKIQFNNSFLNNCIYKKSPCNITNNVWIPRSPENGDDVVIDIRNETKLSTTHDYYYMLIQDLNIQLNSITIIGNKTSYYGSSTLYLDIVNSNLNTTNQFQIVSTIIYFNESSICYFNSISMANSSFISFPNSRMEILNSLEIDSTSKINITNSQFYLYGLINNQKIFEDSFMTFYNSSLYFPSGFSFNKISSPDFPFIDLVESIIFIDSYNSNDNSISSGFEESSTSTSTFYECNKQMISVYSKSDSLNLNKSSLNNINIENPSNNLNILSTSDINNLYGSGQVYISSKQDFTINNNAEIRSNFTNYGKLSILGSTFKCENLISNQSSPPSKISLENTKLYSTFISLYSIEFSNSTIYGETTQIVSNGLFTLQSIFLVSIQGNLIMDSNSTIYLNLYYFDIDSIENPLVIVNGSVNLNNINLVIDLDLNFINNISISSFSISILQIQNLNNNNNHFINNKIKNIIAINNNNSDGIFTTKTENNTIKLYYTIRPTSSPSILNIGNIIFLIITSIIIISIIIFIIIIKKRINNNSNNNNGYISLLN